MIIFFTLCSFFLAGGTVLKHAAVQLTNVETEPKNEAAFLDQTAVTGGSAFSTQYIHVKQALSKVLKDFAFFTLYPRVLREIKKIIEGVYWTNPSLYYTPWTSIRKMLEVFHVLNGNQGIRLLEKAFRGAYSSGVKKLKEVLKDKMPLMLKQLHLFSIMENSHRNSYKKISSTNNERLKTLYAKLVKWEEQVRPLYEKAACAWRLRYRIDGLCNGASYNAPLLQGSKSLPVCDTGIDKECSQLHYYNDGAIRSHANTAKDTLSQVVNSGLFTTAQDLGRRFATSVDNLYQNTQSENLLINKDRAHALATYLEWIKQIRKALDGLKNAGSDVVKIRQASKEQIGVVLKGFQWYLKVQDLRADIEYNVGSNADSHYKDLNNQLKSHQRRLLELFAKADCAWRQLYRGTLHCYLGDTYSLNSPEGSVETKNVCVAQRDEECKVISLGFFYGYSSQRLDQTRNFLKNLGYNSLIKTYISKMRAIRDRIRPITFTQKNSTFAAYRVSRELFFEAKGASLIAAESVGGVSTNPRNPIRRLNVAYNNKDRQAIHSALLYYLKTYGREYPLKLIVGWPRNFCNGPVKANEKVYDNLLFYETGGAAAELRSLRGMERDVCGLLEKAAKEWQDMVKAAGHCPDYSGWCRFDTQAFCPKIQDYPQADGDHKWYVNRIFNNKVMKQIQQLADFNNFGPTLNSLIGYVEWLRNRVIRGRDNNELYSQVPARYHGRIGDAVSAAVKLKGQLDGFKGDFQSISAALGASSPDDKHAFGDAASYQFPRALGLNEKWEEIKRTFIHRLDYPLLFLGHSRFRDRLFSYRDKETEFENSKLLPLLVCAFRVMAVGYGWSSSRKIGPDDQDELLKQFVKDYAPCQNVLLNRFQLG